MIPEYKICPMCLINKKSSEYYTLKNKHGFYLKTYCKSCLSIKCKKTHYNTCICGNNKTKRSLLCQKCRNISNNKYYTLNDTQHYRTKYGQSAAFNIIRLKAKQVTKHIKQCQNCGYSKHVETCHIIPISKFDKNTLISEINNINNLCVLCPNCHWEFDKGLLSISNLKKI